MISLLVRGYIGNDFEMNAERQFGYRKKLRTTLLTKWSLPVGPKKLPNPLLLAWRPSGTWHLFFGGVASIWGHLVNFPFKFSCLWAVLFVVLPQRRGRYPMWLFPRAARPELTRARAMFFCLVGSVTHNLQRVRQRQRRLPVGVVHLPEVRVAVLRVRPRKLSPRKFPSVQKVPSEDASSHRSQTPTSSTRQRHSQVDSCSFHCALHYCSEE